MAEDTQNLIAWFPVWYVIEKFMLAKLKFMVDTSQQRVDTYCTSQMKKEKKSGDKMDAIA